jgi:RNA polymerase sigma-70 factor, ECF subfamily
VSAQAALSSKLTMTDVPVPVALDPIESAFVARLRAGDDMAFTELVRREGGRMLSVARRMLRDEEDARDAVQVAFLSAFKALPRFHGDSRLSTWLHRIVVNSALMKLRSRLRRPEEPIDALLPRYLDDGHQAEPVAVGQLSTEALLLRHEVRLQVRAGIDRLPESYRTVILLRDIEQFDTAETARVLGLTDNAAKLRLHRARQALAKLLAPVLRPGAAQAEAGQTPGGGRS